MSVAESCQSCDQGHAVSIIVACQDACQGPKSPQAVAAPGKPRSRGPSLRLFYIDWVRAFIIALVVAFHSIDLFFNYTYSAAVYIGIVLEPPGDATRQVAIVLAQLMQSWFMGLMFLLSGYFSAPSYDRKGAARFLGDRAVRVLLPLLAYDCFVQPLAFEVARHSPYAPADLQAAPNGFTYYFSTQFVRLGHGAGWFLAVLFIFDLLYAAARGCMWCRSRVAASAGKGWAAAESREGHDGCCAGTAPVSKAAGQQSSSELELPMTLPQPSLQLDEAQPAQLSAMATAAGLLGVAALTAGLCLLVRAGVLLPLGLQQSMWEITGIQFQPAYLPQYAVAFVLGVAAYRAGSGLQRLPFSAGPVAAMAAVVLAAVGGVVMTLFPGSNFGMELGSDASLAYVAVYTVWEQSYAVTMWLAVLVCFRRWVNKEGGALGAAVAGAAYGVYLFHVPVLTAFGLAFGPLSWPAAAKCVVVTPLVVVSSWVVGLLLKQLPGVKRVL